MNKQREIEDWDHYYKIACAKPELRPFKDLLEVNMNMPQVDISKFRMSIEKRLDKEIKYETKTFEQLLQEHKPTKNE